MLNTSSMTFTETARQEATGHYLGRIYRQLTAGLMLSAVTAFAISQIPALRNMFFHTVLSPHGNIIATKATGLGTLAMLSPLILAFMAGMARRSNNAIATLGMYYIMCGTIGISLATIPMIYTGHSIATAVLATAASFFGISTYGLTTKRNLSGMGTFLITGLFAIIIVGIANIFMHNPVLMTALDAIGILLFSGFIAYDSQTIVRRHEERGNVSTLSDLGSDSLSLYLDIINFFSSFIGFFGQPKN